MRPRKTESLHVRLTEVQFNAIRDISNELNQSMSETIRDLITISLIILQQSDKITLKDVLFSISSKLAKSEFAWGVDDEVHD